LSEIHQHNCQLYSVVAAAGFIVRKTQAALTATFSLAAAAAAEGFETQKEHKHHCQLLLAVAPADKGFIFEDSISSFASYQLIQHCHQLQSRAAAETTREGQLQENHVLL
jgi:hypothetical protein